MKDISCSDRATEAFSLRLPKRVKDSVMRRAKEEGLSLNSAIIQRLVKSLKQEDKLNEAL